ncbi:3-deoxy-manno-octulosonate cytidylyltransferase [Patescibacteria group bacterium]|nr:MAG: 3-deoxy-manno-octulosonate cytidylyltransferase [Patescibacteria group bacterium]
MNDWYNVFMKKIKILGIIPARLHSTRLPKKMLADIAGKPLIYYTWRQAKRAKMLDEVIVATDSPEIASAVQFFGGTAMMTSDKHKTGSDRVAEAARRFKKFKPEIVVNLQGDEPLVPPQAINQLVREMKKDKKAVMGTVAIPCNDKEKLKDPDVVKTIIDKNGNAIYFSRSIIPYPRHPYGEYYSKLGLYAFRYRFLQTYVRLVQRPLERAESLEQLRALEHGYKVKAVAGNYIREEVNNLRQLKRVRIIIDKQRRGGQSRK